MKIKDIAKNGLFCDGDWVESKDQDPNGQIRLIQLADIGKGEFLDKSARFMNKETAKKLRCTFLKKNDILIARMPDPIGRCCLFPYDENEKYVTVVDICILRLSKDFDNRYIKHVINTRNLLYQINRQITGTTRKRISRKKLGEIDIPLPPLSTQQQIARILDQADALRKKTQQVIDLYDQLAQSTFLDMFGDPVRNPKGWQFDSIKAITTKIGSGATPKGGKESYISEGISLIRSLNVHDGLFKMKDLAHISDIQAKKLNNVTVEEEDVLLNITGASVCRCTIVPASILPARVNQHVAILRCKKERLNPAFLLHTLISDNSKMKLMSIASKGGATREALTKEDIEKYTIPLPPITLQNQFAEKISLIEKQKELAKQSLQESENLFNALLQKAFKGELVNSV
jgi:type I restriction enzyme, S subunit